MTTHLEQLLHRLRDGVGTPDDLERARALARSDARIPDELREIVLCDPSEAAEDAAGLLAVLGADDLGEILVAAVLAEAGDPEPIADDEDEWGPIGLVLAEGLRAEADGFEIAGEVMKRIAAADFARGAILAEAVVDEAGDADVAEAVLAAVGWKSLPIAAAVAAEAGRVDLADAVLAAVGHGRVAVREALVAEAGTVDVADAVMRAIAPVAAVRRELEARPVVHPVRAPANNNRGWIGAVVAMAAAALIAVGVGVERLMPADPGASTPLAFAHAGDVVVEDLSYAENVVVFQTEGDQGAVILWLDEEA